MLLEIFAMNPTRRRFIRTLGSGSVVVAATAVGLNRCDPMPSEAVAAWDGPPMDLADPRVRALSYAILAPNPHNRQPWLADLREPGVISLYLDQDRLLPHTDPFSRQIMIGHGCFIELLVLAAGAGGQQARVSYFPKGEPSERELGDGPIARIVLEPGDTDADPLFQEILRRRSNKEPYDLDRPLTENHAAGLSQASQDPRVSLQLRRDQDSVANIRQLTEDAMALEMATPQTLRESIDLTRIGAEEIATHRDGIDLHGPLFWWLKTLGLMTREKALTPGTMAYQGGLDYAMGSLAATPSYGWLSTADNRRSTQLATGRAYARVNLQATALGVALHPVSQLLQEYPEMATLQRQLLEATATPEGHTVQMLFRLGYASAPVPSPRRAIEDFLVI